MVEIWSSPPRFFFIFRANGPTAIILGDVWRDVWGMMPPPLYHHHYQPPQVSNYVTNQQLKMGRLHRYPIDWASKSSTCDVMYRRQRPPLILWWSNLEILVGPLHRSSPFIEELRCQAIQTAHDPYITERTPKAVYIVRCLWQAIGVLRNKEHTWRLFPDSAVERALGAAVLDAIIRLTGIKKKWLCWSLRSALCQTLWLNRTICLRHRQG
jgi:hypothetical protein